MNTQFWGPDGWKLLHSVAQNYPKHPNPETVRLYTNFYESIKYVLPCIYCRNSYAEYIEELPVREFTKDRESMTRWMYEMHNKVNGKLRGQGLLHESDPEYRDITHRYENYLKEVNAGDCSCFPGMLFIYCILFNFPLKKDEIDAVRYAHYILFFNYLVEIMPFGKIRELFKEFIARHPIENAMESRMTMKRWGYKLEAFLYKKHGKKCMTYKERCLLIEMNRAGCSKIAGSKKGKNGTCRLPTPKIKKVADKTPVSTSKRSSYRRR
jgi:hypothetical protein